MVTHPRTAPRAYRLRPLNEPRQIRVEASGEGRPRAVWLGSRRREVLGVREHWRIDDEWWRQEISRHYFEVVLAGGDPLTIFHDLAGGQWYVQRATLGQAMTLGAPLANFVPREAVSPQPERERGQVA